MSLTNENNQLNKKSIIKEKSHLKETKSTQNGSNMEQMLKENLSCEMYHFILNVFYSPHLSLKIVHLIFILISSGLALYMTITLVINYFEYNVVTITRTINENPVTFPKVTICNRNILTTKYAYEFLANSINLTDLQTLINSTDRNNVLFTSNGLFMKLMGTVQTTFTDKEKQKLSHPIDHILLSCLFDYEMCTANDFHWEWDYLYGNCYHFNSGYNLTGQGIDLRKSFLSGSGFGLQMELYVNFYEELMFFNSLSNDYGLLIRIDNISHVIDYSLNGIYVSPGSHTYMSLSRDYRETLPKPYSNCDNLESFNSDLYTLIFHSKYEYRQKFCLEQCFQELSIQICNCSVTFVASLRANISLCSSLSQIQCSLQIYFLTYLQNNYVQNICLPRCPLECNSSRITYTSSSNQLMPDIYVNLLKNNPNLRADFINRSLDNENVVLQSIVKLNIFYDSLSYTISTETPQMDIVSLLGNIGGNLGLFMGVCLFSLGEMVVVLVELIFFKD
jgi:hypothetical protein